MCTDCRLLMWPVWILLAAWDTACNTDLCRWVKPQCQRELWALLNHLLWLRGQIIVVICVHLTCWVVCTGWTTWVGTPGAAGGLESDRLSLEWTEPSMDRKRERSCISWLNKLNKKKPTSITTSSVLTTHSFQIVIAAITKHPTTKFFFVQPKRDWDRVCLSNSASILISVMQRDSLGQLISPDGGRNHSIL